LGEYRLLLHREHHDLRVGCPLAQPANCLDARTARHAQVEHEHMRPVTMNVAHGRGQIVCFGDHLYALLALESSRKLRRINA